MEIFRPNTNFDFMRLRRVTLDLTGLPPTPEDVDAGSVRWGHEVSIGYFPQDHTGLIEKGLTAVDLKSEDSPEDSED